MITWTNSWMRGESRRITLNRPLFPSYVGRFSFLDFTEYTSSETASMDSGIISGRSLELPLGSPVRRKYVLFKISPTFISNNIYCVGIN